MLQVHELAELFYLAAAHRHLKIQILQTQNVGVVKPGSISRILFKLTQNERWQRKKCDAGSLLQNSVMFIAIT